MTAQPYPRLSVFISSTIKECSLERAGARKAIAYFGFEPILFEAIGARPHPPRSVYLEGLQRSHICIIIWKDGSATSILHSTRTFLGSKTNTAEH